MFAGSHDSFTRHAHVTHHNEGTATDSRIFLSTMSSQQPVVFTTQTTYPLPTQKYMIPNSWKRYHLSQLVNKALSLAQAVPFDFIIRGEILRTPLGEWCAENGIGEVYMFVFFSIQKFVGDNTFRGLGRDTRDRIY